MNSFFKEYIENHVEVLNKLENSSNLDTLLLSFK